MKSFKFGKNFLKDLSNEDDGESSESESLSDASESEIAKQVYPSQKLNEQIQKAHMMSQIVTH